MVSEEAIAIHEVVCGDGLLGLVVGEGPSADYEVPLGQGGFVGSNEVGVEGFDVGVVRWERGGGGGEAAGDDGFGGSHGS